MSYRRVSSPLHAARAGAGCAYCLALVLAALVLSTPLALGAVTVTVLLAGVSAGVGRELRRAALFALAFGPALTRSLQRFTARLQVTWRAPGGAVAIALAVVLTASVAATEPVRAASTPAGYLLAGENADGGFGAAPGQPSSQLFSGWAALGLAAEGHSPQDVSRAGHSLIGYLRTGAGLLSDAGSLERTILAVRAAGLPATSFGGRDLLSALQHDVRRDGSVGEQINLTAFAVLALRAAGVSPSGSTLSWLTRQQDADGGFNFATAGGTSDVDDTGAALEALADAGGSAAARARARAVAFIRRQQDPDGGFPAGPGAASNAQSTAWAVQGLAAAGVAPGSLHRMGAPSPLGYLSSLIAADGHVRYSRAADETPVWVTAEAVMALAGKPLPLAPVARAPTRPRSPAPRPRAHAVTSQSPSRSGSRAPGAATVDAPAAPIRPTRRPQRRSAAPAVGPGLDRLATDLGIATAILLAPVDAG